MLTQEASVQRFYNENIQTKLLECNKWSTVSLHKVTALRIFWLCEVLSQLKDSTDNKVQIAFTKNTVGAVKEGQWKYDRKIKLVKTHFWVSYTAYEQRIYNKR